MSIGKFSEFYVDVTKDATKIPQEQYLAAGRYPIIDQGQKLIAGMWDNPDGLYEKVPAIVFGDHTRTIKYVDTPFFIGADGVKVLRPVHAGDNVKYLFYVLQAARIPNLGYSRHFKVVKELEIRMYPRKKQDEIVRVLEQIDSLLEQRQNEILQMDILVKSRFVEMFIGKGYEEKSVRDVLDTAFWLMPATPKFVENGSIPYITSKNIKNRSIDFDNVKYITTEAYESISSNRPTQIGDILISMIGTLGQTAVIKDARRFYGQNLYLLRLNASVINTVFFCEFFNSDRAQHKLQAKRNQSTQAYLKANHVEDLLLPLPPMEIQEQFAAFVAEVDKSKLAVKQSLEKLETLKKSLMQQYFG